MDASGWVGRSPEADSEGAMRRWRLLNRWWQPSPLREPVRCVLVLEELEGREVLNGSLVVHAPLFEGPPQIPESASFLFSSEDAFFVTDSNNTGQDYGLTLTATHGTITLDQSTASNFGLSVSNNGTAAVTLSGQLDPIDNFLAASGFRFVDTPYYSGDAAVDVTARDLQKGGPSSTGEVIIQVQPVASQISLNVAASGEVYLPSPPSAFPPGLLSVTDWPDQDGSETVTVSIGLNTPNLAGVTLSAGGVILTPDSDGFWNISASSASALQAMLNSLVLTPPSGFTGRVDLSVFASVTDAASYPSTETTASDFFSTDTQDLQLRFFLGGSITAPPAFANEGETIDLGGRYSVADPDELPGDLHTVRISVPSGTLALNRSAIPPGLSAGTDPTSSGTTILLEGTIAAINQFLATPGCVTYRADSPFFSGRVPLTLTLTNDPGPAPPSGGMPLARTAGVPAPVTSVSSLFFMPVAEHAVPTALDVATPQDTPVALSLSVMPLMETDGTETLLIILDGVPDGASFNRGTNLGNGEWAFAPADLSDLTFTPPAGQSGVYNLTVKAVVTDVAADIGASDTATETTMFRITVTAAAPSPTPTPTLLLPPEFILEEFGDVSATGSPASEPAPGAPADPGPPTGPEDAADVVHGDVISLISPTAAATNPDLRAVQSELQVSYTPTAGSLFTHNEAPQPAYTTGEKHPLPPVLPLDQTLPVAGFTESGGDSFALVDSLYRGTADPNTFSRTQPTAPPKAEVAVTATEPRATPAATAVSKDSSAPPSRQEGALQRQAGQPRTGQPGAGRWAADPSTTAAANSGDDEQTGEWRAATAAVMVGSFALWFTARTHAARHLLRFPRRQVTERMP